jgi:hypothetical protein
MMELVRQLAGRKPVQALRPVQVWNGELDASIAAVIGGWAEQVEAKYKPYAHSFLSGMHLWNDSLDASHTISQDIHTPDGSYWHAIMHRMEGDYWNSKYWYKRVGNHPIFTELHLAVFEMAKEPGVLASVGSDRVKSELESLVLSDRWNSDRFVDAVERQVEKERHEAAVALLERIQWFETVLLLRHCYRGAGELPDINLNAALMIGGRTET